MRAKLFSVIVVLQVIAAACTLDAASESTERTGVVEQELTYRYCTTAYDCASADACECVNNQCVPDGFGPAHPDCGAAPPCSPSSCSPGWDCHCGDQCWPAGYACP